MGSRDMYQLSFHPGGFLAVGQGADADGLRHVQVLFVHVRERTLVADYAPDIARMIQFQRHVFLFAACREGDAPGNQEEKE